MTQRKFQEEHAEESYFDSDDDTAPADQPPSNTVVPPAVDEVAAQEGEGDLHRTARMFSLNPTPILNHGNAPHIQENQPPQQETTCQENSAPSGRSDTLDGKIS